MAQILEGCPPNTACYQWHYLPIHTLDTAKYPWNESFSEIVKEHWLRDSQGAWLPFPNRYVRCHHTAEHLPSRIFSPTEASSSMWRLDSIPLWTTPAPKWLSFLKSFPPARDLVQHKCLDCSDATHHTPKSGFSSSPDHAHNSSPPAHYLVHTLGCASGCCHYSKIALVMLITPSLTNKYVFTPTLQCLVEEAQTMLPYPICKQYVFLLSSMETW